MLNPQTLDQLSTKIGELLPPGLKSAKSDFDARVRTLLGQQLANFEMVSREEFELQTRVLQRTREKLERLEARLAELEKSLD